MNDDKILVSFHDSNLKTLPNSFIHHDNKINNINLKDKLENVSNNNKSKTLLANADTSSNILDINNIKDNTKLKREITPDNKSNKSISVINEGKTNATKYINKNGIEVEGDPDYELINKEYELKGFKNKLNIDTTGTDFNKTE